MQAKNGYFFPLHVDHKPWLKFQLPGLQLSSVITGTYLVTKEILLLM